MSMTPDAEALTGLGGALHRARLVDLEQPRFAGQPGLDQHGAGLQFTLHRRHEPGLAKRTSSSGLLISSDHAGTHIDALSHQAVDCQLHGQVAVTAEVQTPTGFTTHSAEEIPPLIGRGVLLDVAADGPLAPRQTITVADLEKAAAGLAIPAGATVLVRTGWGTLWDDPPRYLEAPGLNLPASQWVADHRPVAVGIDNARWDELDVVDPTVGYRSPGHALFLVQEGVYIIENLLLEELAQSGQREFAFVCLPLKLRGATGSPVRPVALLEGAAA
ncbi:MAG TPA: cyclase family protein [Conexibacter sp.]|jgi:kynurenine formamidase